MRFPNGRCLYSAHAEFGPNDHWAHPTLVSLMDTQTTDVEIQKLMYGSESNHSHNGVMIYFAITTIMLAPLLFY